MSTKAYSTRVMEEIFYSCTCMKAKGGWGLTCRIFDLANPELRVLELEVRAYTSPLPTTNQSHRCGAPLDFPTRRHTKALTLILASFRSIRSSCLIIKLSFPSSP